MNITAAIKWLENLREDIGTCDHSSLWNYEQALVEITQLLKKFDWISCKQHLPDEDGVYYVTNSSDEVVVYAFIKGHAEKFWKKHAKAWMPVPDPYMKDKTTTVMTLDEAIEHCEDVFKTEECKDCANEHLQLANWLKELKQVREITNVSEENKDKFYVVPEVKSTRYPHEYWCSCGNFLGNAIGCSNFCSCCGKEILWNSVV